MPAGDAVVRAFFEDVGVAGLVLPDGWFGGRAMESHHQLTFVASRPKRLLVELDDQVLLAFSGAPSVTRLTTDLAMKSGTRGLVIASFTQLVLDFLGYGDDEPHATIYSEGTVTFVAPD